MPKLRNKSQNQNRTFKSPLSARNIPKTHYSYKKDLSKNYRSQRILDTSSEINRKVYSKKSK